MYIESMILVDPAQATEIVRKPPTKMFAKLVHVLLPGGCSTELEHETFAAVAILQQLNRVLRSIGVNDMVRLLVDQTTYYEDREGRENDLDIAMSQLAERGSESGTFERMDLLLNHRKAGIEYLIAIRILRSHAVGDFPIQLTVNAYPEVLNARGDETRLKREMSRIFKSQSEYDQFTEKYETLASDFVAQLEDALLTKMELTDLRVETKRRALPTDATRRPGSRSNRRDAYTEDDDAWAADDYSDDHLLYSDHHGHAEVVAYAWLWSELAESQNIDDQQLEMADPLANTTADLPGDPTPSENATVAAVADDATSFTDDTSRQDHGGWLSGLFDFSSDSSWFDSFSGDGDAGSCGGGCGGGCGGE